MKKGKSRNKRKKTRSRLLWIAIAVIGIAAVISAVCVAGMLATKENAWRTPEELLVEYMDHIPKQEYEEMYAMLYIEASGNVSREDFVKRNSAIYEGIEVQNMTVEILTYDEEQMTVTYQTSFDTVAGTISFENEALFLKGEDGYKLVWDDSMIFPNLTSTDKVRVSTTQAERGEILDRNGRVLAGKGTASSVGIVPGKLENREEAIAQIAELLETTPEAIEKKLSAQWVKDDSFVPIKTIPRVEEIELMKIEPDEEVLKEKERHEKLLEIPGVMISDVEVRKYPLGEAAAHLVGYVQSVTAEDLEEHAGEGYAANSVIGRSRMEGLFEKELKGQNGCRIYIVNSAGKEKEELAYILVQHGQDIELTIDADLQVSLYEQFKEDKSCSVAMNPYTGEVLALVSTPSYDNNDLIIGLSSEQWTALNEDEDKPMYNRFRQVWCPGSTFKPITAAIGLQSGAIDPTEDYGNVGLSWQKDASWGSYYVTTLHAYEPVILENALIYSDNIYFAKRIWECVQLEIKRRKKYLEEHGTNSYSHRPECNPFASKIICGDCNKVFARKGWRSSTGVDRKVWQCSERYKVKGVMGCANRHVEEETLIKAYLMAWNALVENREDFMEQWTEQLQSENLLESYRAEKFIEYTDGAKPLTEMDTDFMLKTLDHIKVFEDGTLLVVFLDGTEIECKNEEE